MPIGAPASLAIDCGDCNAMKLLLLLQDIPFPPATGINTKVFNVLKRLSGAGWECDLLCFATGDWAPRRAALEACLPGVKVLDVHAPPTGATLVLKKVLAFLRGLPPSLAGFGSASFAASLEAVAAAKKYDVVHYDVINMSQYLGFGPAAPSLLSSNDAISLAYDRMIAQNASPLRKLYLAAATALIRRYERRVYIKFDMVHVVSAEDADHLRSIAPGLRLVVIPVAVDSSYLEPGPFPRRPGPPRVLFMGNLNIPGIANGLFDFLDGAYADLAASAPPFEFRVLGPKASAAQEARLAGCPGLKYFKWVEDYRAFVAEADVVLVLDKSGTGIKTRVLEAMALGRPVIGTDIAFGGIEARDREHCLLRRTPQEIAEALAHLLHDPLLAAELGAHARELVLARYSIDQVGPCWEKLYADLVGEKSVMAERKGGGLVAD